MKPKTAFRLSVLLSGFLASVAPPATAADNIVVFDWAGYEDPAFHPSYTEKFGGEPDFSFFGDEEEAFQKSVGAVAGLCEACINIAPALK